MDMNFMNNKDLGPEVETVDSRDPETGSMTRPGFHVPDTRNPMKAAINRGSSKSGAHHWWIQRVTAAALIVLGLWFVFTVIGLVGSSYEDARQMLSNPWNAVLLILFTAIGFWHGQLGLQVVIEDYVHVRWQEVVLTVVIKMLAVLLALACAVAVLRVTFGG